MEDNTLDLLLQMDIPSPMEKKVKIKRLSKICGKPIVFKLKQLSYNRLNEIIEQHRFDNELSVFTVLAATVSPDLKNKDLLEKFNAVTPAELLKTMLLPGEIQDLSNVVADLCGYRGSTIEMVENLKKK
jgi:hypothetical protein